MQVCFTVPVVSQKSDERTAFDFAFCAYNYATHMQIAKQPIWPGHIHPEPGADSGKLRAIPSIDHANDPTVPGGQDRRLSSGEQIKA